ncbi:hypothetical protein SE18_21825 [Herpetosiphon geysericola]|uniref:NAD(+) ADP-ribosyltransferase n=1 Tax=Herpetosiphon geysericola TaxID=70996 RepID=A0A0P6Y792_9CHLR|nr:hypothetical protein SE18_21825 [Herpetosiphon geysericola]
MRGAIVGTAIGAPQGEPTQRRKFQLTNLDGNNNKYYLVEMWQLAANDVFFRATYGRVGSVAQVDERVTNHEWIERKIREKVKKGYHEVALHRPSVVAAAPEPVVTLAEPIRKVIDYIFDEAGEGIASYLAVGLDAISAEQIEHGRKLLSLAQLQHSTWQQSQTPANLALLSNTVQHFYNTVPTKLPSKIKRETVIENFCNDFDEQETRLHQLEAAIATMSAQQRNPQVSRYEILGAELDLLAQNDDRYRHICDYVDRTSVHGYKVRVNSIFTLKIGAERRNFEQNQLGRSNTQLLFHGTAGQNVRHILRSGLVCPRTPSNGRMFGHGIYFANKATKSTNYCSVRRRNRPMFLFLADVALGNPFVAPTAQSDFRAAPKGFDSVWGKAQHTTAWGGKLQYDEFIVYQSAQQSLRYLVLFDR